MRNTFNKKEVRISQEYNGILGLPEAIGKETDGQKFEVMLVTGRED